MAAQKVYSESELLVMTKVQMRRILQEEHQKTDEQVKLGHRNKPYRELIMKSQGSSVQSPKGRGKNKGKLLPPPINPAFEAAKRKLADDEDVNKNDKRNRFFQKNQNHNETDSLGRFDEHDRSLEDVDELETFAANVNNHYGKSIFCDEYLERLAEEEVEIGQFQAMLVNFTNKGVLTLTNKGGDYRMKGEHIMKMYDFMVQQQVSVGGNFGVGASIGAKGGCVVADVGVGSEGGGGVPFLGDADTPPDYRGMIRYIYDKLIKSWRTKRLIIGKKLLDDTRNFLAEIYEANSGDLGGIEYAFDATFLRDFQLMWGGDIWDAVKDWCETSAEYSKYKKEKASM